jgi:hypothetical protein
MNERLLQCKVDEGMFSDENVVTFDALDGHQVAFFVPKSKISDNCVKVKLMIDGNHYLAVMPNEDQSIVPIHSNIVAA